MSTLLQNEKELLKRIADGDETAFTTVVDGYWNKIFSVALTYIKIPARAEDAVQEIFLRVWKNREKLRDIQSLDNYLFIVIRNEVFSAMRKKGPMYPVGSYLESTLEEKAPSAPQTLEAKQLQEMIKAAIDHLPERRKETLKLSREQGLSYEEIAKRMGVSQNTVKVQMLKALNFLRTYIREHSDLLNLLILINLKIF